MACGEAGAVIGAVALVITFAAGYGMWSAYVLAQAHGSLLRLLWAAFLRRHERKSLDREEWRAGAARPARRGDVRRGAGLRPVACAPRAPRLSRAARVMPPLAPKPLIRHLNP